VCEEDTVLCCMLGFVIPTEESTSILSCIGRLDVDVICGLLLPTRQSITCTVRVVCRRNKHTEHTEQYSTLYTFNLIAITISSPGSCDAKWLTIGLNRRTQKNIVKT